MSSIQADIKQIFLQDEQNRRIFFLNRIRTSNVTARNVTSLNRIRTRNATAKNVTFLNKMQANNVHLQGGSPGLVVK